MCLVHVALQRLGAVGVPALDARRQDAQEASHRGPGQEVAGALLGHAPRRRRLARRANGPETDAAAVQAAALGRGRTAPRGETTGGTGADCNVTTGSRTSDS